MSTLVMAIIGAVAAAIAGATAGGIKAYKNNKQAQQLKLSTDRLQKQVENKEISSQEALNRLNAMIENTKGDLRVNIGKAIQDTIYNYKQELERALKIGTQEIKNAMISRGLGGSQAMLAQSNKLNEQLQKNYAEQVKNLTDKQMNQLNQVITELNKQGYDRAENIYSDLENFKINNINEISKMDSLIGQLDTGAGGVFGNVVTGFLSGGANKDTLSALSNALVDYKK